MSIFEVLASVFIDLKTSKIPKTIHKEYFN